MVPSLSSSCRGGARVAYPLEVGGVDDYRIKVGSMLLTLVDPNRGFEVAYNRWYERDHFYAGCMIGPFLFAGSRWVATRALKDARWPTRRRDDRVAARRGFVRRDLLGRAGHHADHFDVWARHQVRELYAEGRGFAERKHTHTVLFDHLGAAYRDADRPVPIELALDHGYDGLVIVWLDGRGGRDARALHDALAQHARARAARAVADRDRELVDAVGGRERSARRPDGSRQQGRRPGAACASCCSSPATCSDALPAVRALHRRDRGRRISRPRGSSRRSSARSSAPTSTSTSSGSASGRSANSFRYRSRRSASSIGWLAATGGRRASRGMIARRSRRCAAWNRGGRGGRRGRRAPDRRCRATAPYRPALSRSAFDCDGALISAIRFSRKRLGTSMEEHSNAVAIVMARWLPTHAHGPDPCCPTESPKRLDRVPGSSR